MVKRGGAAASCPTSSPRITFTRRREDHMGLVEQISAALGDRYRIERELGRGGMAVVLLAQDLKHNRPVAIKTLKPEISALLGSERFLREIDTAATLQHPHILPLYDSGSADGLLYYVMPFAEGESLRQRLEREHQLPLDAALRITREVASALQYAHERGVIHRDIKPENIMLSGSHAVVADFGIARALNAAGDQQLTQTGMVVGTPQYMSPEQASGDTVDGRSDQYSLACSLYEMLTGQPPFVGPSAQAVIARHSIDPVPSIRTVRATVPPAVESAIVRAMAKIPADRFRSMEEFLESLESAAIPSPSSASLTPSLTPQRPRVNWRVASAVGVAILLTIVAWQFVAARKASGAAGSSNSVTAVAVLPFQEVANNADSAYLAEGMTEGLIADLAGVGSLKVISRFSGTMAQETPRPLAQLASGLGVDAVVNGTIRRTGDTVTVDVRMLRARDSTTLFARSYQRRLGELPDLQREITTAVTGAIRARLPSTEQDRLNVRHEIDQRAYEAYLRGRFLLERDDLEQARKFFERAGELAPEWAPPYVGLANYYAALPFSTDLPPVDVLRKARDAVGIALQLDESLPEAHATNAYLRAYFEWDWRAAEHEFRRALELRPNYADAYFSYSRFLASRRRLDEAIAQLGRAVELDPLSISLQANRALLDYFAGRYDEAATRLHEIIETDSTDVLAKWGLALVAEQQGRPDEAIAILEPITGRSMLRKSTLGHAYALAGNRARARSILTELEEASAQTYVPSYWFAVVHAGLGENDQALQYLERAYEERSTVLAYLLIDPRLEPLRNDPRFVNLANRLGAN
jgi:eukaryotic-like serine/threonine-protein kinase